MRRRKVMSLIGFGFLPAIAGCGKSGLTLTVVMYSYLDRPIFEINLNGEPLGAANAYGTTSMVTGVSVVMGEQKLSLTLGGPEGMPRNGETVAVKNRAVIKASDIPSRTHYMGLYLYPDDTAEFTFGEFMPGHSTRGEVLMKSVRANGR